MKKKKKNREGRTGKEAPPSPIIVIPVISSKGWPEAEMSFLLLYKKFGFKITDFFLLFWNLCELLVVLKSLSIQISNKIFPNVISSSCFSPFQLWAASVLSSLPLFTSTLAVGEMRCAIWGNLHIFHLGKGIFDQVWWLRKIACVEMETNFRMSDWSSLQSSRSFLSLPVCSHPKFLLWGIPDDSTPGRWMEWVLGGQIKKKKWWRTPNLSELTVFFRIDQRIQENQRFPDTAGAIPEERWVCQCWELSYLYPRGMKMLILGHPPAPAWRRRHSYLFSSLPSLWVDL